MVRLRVRLRSFALLLSAWLGFYMAQAVIAIGLMPKGAFGPREWITVDGSVAVLWAVLSVAIAAWHRRVRQIAPNLWALIALHLPVFLGAAWIDAVLARALISVLNPSAPVLPLWSLVSSYSDFDFVSYAAIVAVVETLVVRRALAERQRHAIRLEHSLTRARLDYLEAQLQPHFLFNSLGAVSELAYDAPATAALVLQQLSAVFRTAITQKADEVTLGDELVELEPYLDIQRVRFTDWLTIEYRIDESAVDCLVPRFVLQPLVENAIRHGLSGRSAAGTIRIEATVESDTLVVRIADDGVGLARTARPGRGIGLANVRERLSILYGDDRLRLLDGPSGVTAEVRVPLSRRESSPPPVETPEVAAPADATLDPSPRLPAFLAHPAARIALVWIAFAGIWIQQSYIYLLVRHRLARASWVSLARADATNAALWALITPLVLAGAKRYPIGGPRAWRRVAGVALAGLAVIVAHLELLRLLSGQTAPLWSPSFYTSMVVDAGIYCVLVVVAHRAALADWLRAREADTSTLERELARARDRSADLRRIPPVLLNALEGITATVRRDPSATERQLTRLGDYLRVALECADAAGITPDRRRRLDAAAVALRESGAFTSDLTLSA